ncbi:MULTISPECIES: ABC-three component system protein [spotted fever group]|uniref:ABC-three component systems C-terminal domain-containing protein n=1 Tax=Rickettsia tamurae subsp. buchneri TaxID=1462938 RepID=A0A8E0WKA1_9RICK|nr:MULTISPECIES: ABC-three component system protein [spotted fever group]EER20755.1 hypothetical protein REIS_2265 [Rickettsia endosymbiont of Ixodes scapularis]KDO02141.1 hypothetical protein REISMN_08790 [Rickettsia tamurae subsp. buchneri]
MLRTNDTINSNVEVLKAKKEALESQIERDKKELSKFKVHAQYKELQEEADECTRIMHSAVNKKAILQQYLESSMQSVEYKKPPADTELDYLYEQLGVHFSQNVKKTLQEVRTFHEKIVKDRERFLRADTVSLRNRIEDLDTTIRNADDKRSEIMTTLKDHGALEEFYKLQARLLAKQQKLSEILEKLRSE